LLLFLEALRWSTVHEIRKQINILHPDKGFMEPLLSNIANRLAEVFGDEALVVVAYLFGSKSKGVETSQSDTDIAVLLSELPENLLDFYVDLIDRLSELLGGNIDLIVLNTAPPLPRHQVIKHGRIVYCRDWRARVEFEVRAEKEYMDFNRYRERYDEVLLEVISAWKG